MDNRETSPCEGLIEYLTGEGLEMQRKRFERHLTSCSTCQEEAILWHEVWDRLADDMDLRDLPADLKDEVLGPLIEKENAEPKSMKRRTASLFESRIVRLGAASALIIIVFLSGWLMKDLQIQSIGKETSIETPSSIETLFQLNAERSNGKFNDSKHAYGVACLVRSDDDERLVVYVFGSPQTRDGEAYQVWLWKGGKRTSAGTFTVGSSGIGIMTLPLSHGIKDIDAVGVTLEPDSHSTIPRGPKMFGSTPQSSSGEV
ncbi:anti-sigma factor [Cohnella mopanensis]|uniref:anti-sigma factor n=1 Tax=Cohnella mopanensis TaxID=2911966 RepID=UPI001EF91587|nr:anti-sigma factor [Cohnella mopanensis]